MTLGTVEASMTLGDSADLQRLATLVEANRERLQAIEQQVRSLESLRVEQTHAIEALDAISEDGEEGEMVPLGAGVQIIADIPPEAGAEVDEKVWRMPLNDAYDKKLNCAIADMKNIGGRDAGSITAAQFLQRYINKVPWAHLDIAGTAWADGGKPTVPKGATGWGCLLYPSPRPRDRG